MKENPTGRSRRITAITRDGPRIHPHGGSLGHMTPGQFSRSPAEDRRAPSHNLRCGLVRFTVRAVGRLTEMPCGCGRRESLHPGTHGVGFPWTYCRIPISYRQEAPGA